MSSADPPIHLPAISCPHNSVHINKTVELYLSDWIGIGRETELYKQIRYLLVMASESSSKTVLFLLTILQLFYFILLFFGS